MEPWRLTLKLWRLTRKPWTLNLELCMEAHPGVEEIIQEMWRITLESLRSI
jgi:hypothetical protein